MRLSSIKNKLYLSWIATIFCVAVLNLSIVGQSHSAEVGVAKRVKNNVTASKGNRKLSRNDAVHSGERISAKRKSHGELLLKDNTKIIVGENSTVSLDSFSVSNGGIKKGTLRVAKGALRLITGNKARKGAYTVKTPNATIGARGTGFDTYYNSDGSTEVVLIQGSLKVCSSRTCIISRGNCDIVRIARGGAISKKPHLRSGALSRSQEDKDFDLFARQGKYAGQWRLPTIGCDAKRNRKNNERIRKLRDAKSDEPKTPIRSSTPATPIDPESPVTIPDTSSDCCSALALDVATAAVDTGSCCS